MYWLPHGPFHGSTLQATDQRMKLKTATRGGCLGIGDDYLWAVSLYLASHFQISHLVLKYRITSPFGTELLLAQAAIFCKSV